LMNRWKHKNDTIIKICQRHPCPLTGYEWNVMQIAK
jgi:hypothetical protein